MKLADVAAALSGTLLGDPDTAVSRIASLQTANDDTLTFVLTQSAALSLGGRPLRFAVTYTELPNIAHQIIVKNPRKALAQTIALFYPDTTVPAISPHAIISPSATLGEHLTIYPGAVIGDNVTIGDRCIIYPNVTLYANTVIGNDVIIHAGSVIGGDGFGYYHENKQFKKIPHIGRVIIGDSVEIGANVAIDRGVLDDTIVGQGTKIDNLCHIAHNSQIGDHCAIAGQSGTVGHAVVGNHVQIGGQVGINDVIVGDGAIIAARSGVTRSVAANSMVSGFPAGDHRQELKKDAWIRSQFQKRKAK